MNSPSRQSPTFKNLHKKQKHSPIEIKEKMRKDYKNRVNNSRNLLMNRFREFEDETKVRNTLTEIYEDMFKFNELDLDADENDILLEIRNELRNEFIQEELQWWFEEHEKSRMENIDWSELAQEDNVICLVCQKTNFLLRNGILSCPNCSITIKTQISIRDLRTCISSSIEKHSAGCDNNKYQFIVVPDLTETHIYLICNFCKDMFFVI